MPKPPIIGTPNNDTIGTSAPYTSRKATAAQAETIYGGDGNDTIYGFGGNDVLYGDDGNLTLPDNSTVGDNNDTLFGGDGNDSIFGEQGNDNLDGGNGGDSISGGDGNDSLNGGGGNDSLNGGAGTDTAIHAGAWINYRITNVGGATTVVDNRGGSPDGTDTVTDVEIFRFANGTFTAAEIVNDTPEAVADSATSLEAGGLNNGTPGVDPTGNVLTNDTDPDSGLGDTKTVQGVASGALAGPLGSDVGATVAGTYGGLVLQADGTYVYRLDNGNPMVEALNPGDQLTDVFTYTVTDAAGETSTTTLTVTINGATNASTLVGTAGDDTILGLEGDDIIYGDPMPRSGEAYEPGSAPSFVGGDDEISSGGGNDIIYGDWSFQGSRASGVGGGSDEISGGDGDDIIYSDQVQAVAHERFWGGFIGGGSDTIAGGDGNDIIYSDQVTAGASGYFRGGAVLGGNDTVAGGDGNDIIYGDQFTASSGSTWSYYGYYYGGTIGGGNDTIAGGGGDDTIYGDGVDANAYAGTVSGGDDVITGGTGSDLIYGDWAAIGDHIDVNAGGNDTFIYLTTGDGGDTLADFGALGEDLIDVSAIDANTALGGDQAFGFAGTAATNFSIWFSDDGTDTTLFFDNNGNAAADISIVLLGVNGTDLSLADFA